MPGRGRGSELLRLAIFAHAQMLGKSCGKILGAAGSGETPSILEDEVGRDLIDDPVIGVVFGIRQPDAARASSFERVFGDRSRRWDEESIRESHKPARQGRVSLFECNSTTQMFLAERARGDGSPVDTGEVLDALVPIVIGCDESDRSTVAIAERFSVEVRREQNVRRDGVLPNEDGSAMVRGLGDQILPRTAGDAERLEDLNEWDTGPAQSGDGPRRDAVEIGNDVSQSDGCEFRVPDRPDGCAVA